MSNSREPATPVEQAADGILLHLLVFPKSRSNAIAGVRNGRLLVKVTAPPEDGKANAATIKLLAKQLGVALSSVELLHGNTSREKTLRLQHLSQASLNLLVDLVDSNEFEG